jgi:hypothetical protein
MATPKKPAKANTSKVGKAAGGTSKQGKLGDQSSPVQGKGAGGLNGIAGGAKGLAGGAAQDATGKGASKQ